MTDRQRSGAARHRAALYCQSLWAAKKQVPTFESFHTSPSWRQTSGQTVEERKGGVKRVGGDGETIGGEGGKQGVGEVG